MKMMDKLFLGFLSYDPLNRKLRPVISQRKWNKPDFQRKINQMGLGILKMEKERTGRFGSVIPAGNRQCDGRSRQEEL